jgi:transposase
VDVNKNYNAREICYEIRTELSRLFSRALAKLQNFRRLVVRYERYAENFLGMLYLACCVILMRYL